MNTKQIINEYAFDSINLGQSLVDVYEYGLPGKVESDWDNVSTFLVKGTEAQVRGYVKKFYDPDNGGRILEDLNTLHLVRKGVN